MLTPEVQQLLEQVRPNLTSAVFGELQRILQAWVQAAQVYRGERRQAEEALNRVRIEHERQDLELRNVREEVEQLRRENLLFRTLLESESLEMRPYLNQVMDAIISLTGAEKGICMLFATPGEVRGEPAELIARDFDEKDIHLVREQLELSQGICRQAISSRRLVYTQEAVTDSRFQEHASVRLLRLQTVLCAPFVADDDRVLGLIYLEHRHRSDAFHKTERSLIELVVSQVSRWVSRQRIVSRASEAIDHTAVFRERYGFKEIVGRSEGLAKVLRLITMSLDLKSSTPILITGESGTGKELVARALHFNSARARGPFIAVNCGAIPDSLIESTLFGHVRGAFSGADRMQPGKFEAADGGTLFLDEVGELTMAAQVKLLRILQEREVSRVGDNVSRAIDVRVIAATNRDLRQMVRDGLFREDLYFRLDVFSIHIPPLRERRDDIGAIAEQIVARLNVDRPEPLELGVDAIAFLQRCELPGNVRELENRLTRASMHATDGRITSTLLLATDRPGAGPERNSSRSFPTWKEATEAFQSQLLVDALRKTNRNLLKTAEMLGISRQHLSRLLHEYKLDEYRPPHRGRKSKEERDGY